MNTMTEDFMSVHLINSNDEKEHNLKVPSPALVPLMYLERFSDWADIPKSVLQEKVDMDSIPTVVVGRRKMVDISQLEKYLLVRRKAPDQSGF